MATISAVGIERSGPAIRVALAQHAPAEQEDFEAELRGALTAAAEDLAAHLGSGPIHGVGGSESPAATARSRRDGKARMSQPPPDTMFASSSVRVHLIRGVVGLVAFVDLARVAAVLDRWHTRATMAANPLDPAEQAQLARARTGDVAGLRRRDADGTWTTV